MPLPTFSIHDARRLTLHAQGLLQPPVAAASKADVLSAIRRMGALQIDTIHVVARSPYLSLWSRLGEYEPAWLDQLLAEGALFEYWSHAACFVPIEDYPYYRRRMFENGTKTWFRTSDETLARVREHIRQNGEVRSADFETPKEGPGGWWSWKEEKHALEQLHTQGDLMIARRHNFQRVYDLRERVLPDWDDSRTPSWDETLRFLTLKTVKALGVVRPGWAAQYFYLPKLPVGKILKELEREGWLLPVEVNGWKEPALVHRDHAAALEQAAAGKLEATTTTLLSPFDALIWDRQRVREAFDFDFALECYLPQAKRVYGYYLLTILHRGELVGRLDAKAYRKEKVFEVKALYLEEGVRADEDLARSLAEALKACATWHRTPDVRVLKCRPEGFLPLLTQAIKD